MEKRTRSGIKMTFMSAKHVIQFGSEAIWFSISCNVTFLDQWRRKKIVKTSHRVSLSLDSFRVLRLFGYLLEWMRNKMLVKSLRELQREAVFSGRGQRRWKRIFNLILIKNEGSQEVFFLFLLISGLQSHDSHT